MHAEELRALAREPYISLVTFRRTGAGVATPVWFAERDGRLWVFTEADAGKVKRLRRDPRARIAACSVRGRVHGVWHEARARVVADAGQEQAAYAALRAKYGWQMRAVDFFSRLAGRIGNRAVLEVEPLRGGGA
jgi:PPOX class probable F420-dependent enzyme